MTSFTFRAMGTTVSLTGPADADRIERAGRAVADEFARLERILSRFDPGSDVCRLNDGAGTMVRVAPETRAVLRKALDAARSSEGLFDPTVLPALEAAGYDRDFDAIDPATVVPRPPEPARRWGDVVVRGEAALVPAGAAIDLGGIAKGWAADRAATLVQGLPWFVVDAGGDMRVCGASRTPIEVAVDNPFEPGGELGRILVGEGAVATSSTLRRAWGERLHHLIDPRTSLPARTGVVQATAVAATCAEAEVAAKRLVLGGVPLLDVIPGMVVFEDGRVYESITPDDRASAA